MNPKAFIDLANDLCRQSENEAALRSAVSRSYYGLFNSLKRFYENYFPRLPKEAETHNTVYYGFHNCGVQDAVNVASTLNDLRTERNYADYDLEIDKFQDPNLANLLLVKARSAYNDFQKIASNSKNRKKIYEGIRTYNKKIRK